MASTPYKYLISNPLNPGGEIVTERKTIKPGRFNFGKTDSKSMAQEIKQRYPWMIVREYEDNNSQKKTRATFTMPVMPWKYDRERHLSFAETYNAYYQYLQEELKNGEETEGELLHNGSPGVKNAPDLRVAAPSVQPFELPEKVNKGKMNMPGQKKPKVQKKKGVTTSR